MMQFELDTFLSALYGLTREETCATVALKQEALISDISQLKRNEIKNSLFTIRRFQISFLYQLKIELANGLETPSSTFDKIRSSQLVSI